jgi:hypothetical protein
MAVNISLKNLINSSSALMRGLGDSVRNALDLSAQKIVLDMNGIESCSRAFAHELLVIEEECRAKGQTFELINLCPEISSMLEVVKRSSEILNRPYRPELVPVQMSLEEASALFDADQNLERGF